MAGEPTSGASVAKGAPPSAITVAAINGSLRPGSFTRRALEIALRGAAGYGVQTRLIDLRDYDLAFCDGAPGKGEYPEGVRRLRDDVRAAHGVILGTPEYHGGVSGVLKNALDLMGFNEFEGKMLGLVGVAGGGIGAVDALNALRTVGRALHAWVIPEQASIAHAWRVFDRDGNLTNPDLERRLLTVGEQVARFAHLHHCAEAHAFLREWEEAPINPGGENR